MRKLTLMPGAVPKHTRGAIPLIILIMSLVIAQG